MVRHLIRWRRRVRLRVRRRTPATLPGVAGLPTRASSRPLSGMATAPTATVASERIKSLRFMSFSPLFVILGEAAIFRAFRRFEFGGPLLVFNRAIDDCHRCNIRSSIRTDDHGRNGAKQPR